MSFYIQGRSDKGPAKDIITMMKEFQAENERRRTVSENNPATLNAISNEMLLESTSNDPSQVNKSSVARKEHSFDHQVITVPNQSKMNPFEQKSAIDRNKLTTKTNRLPSDTLKVR